MSQMATGYACPTCEQEGKGNQMLFSLPNSSGVRCPNNSQHFFTETEDILRFKRIPVAPQADKVQSNQTQIAVMVPTEVKAALEVKYGARLNATVAALLNIATLPRIVFLMEEDVRRIEEQTGQQIKSGAQLFGAFFAEKKKAEENMEELDKLRRTLSTLRGTSPTCVLVDLKEQLPIAVAKSVESGKTLEQYVGDFLYKAFENNWTE